MYRPFDIDFYWYGKKKVYSVRRLARPMRFRSRLFKVINWNSNLKTVNILFFVVEVTNR